MRRHPYSYRANHYNEADFYTLVPCGRKPVAPGERLSKAVIDMHFVSTVFDKANLTPMLGQVWLFYVPFRIVWDQWVEFIAKTDAAPTRVPEAAAGIDWLFERGATDSSALIRRCYKIAYNQYFGDNKYTAAWYTDITADDEAITPGRLLAWDQFQSKQRRNDYTPGVMAIDTSGATGDIDLDQLSYLLTANRNNRRLKMSGEKYVDAMRTMGVDLDWRVQNAPEFLGSAQKVFMPVERTATNATEFHQRAMEYRGRLGLSLTQRKAFAEHGMLIALAGFRPSLMSTQGSAQDNWLREVDDFWIGLQSAVPDGNSGSLWTSHGAYLYGGNTVGANQNEMLFGLSVGDTARKYVDPSLFDANKVTNAPPAHVAFFADAVYKGLTPVKQAL